MTFNKSKRKNRKKTVFNPNQEYIDKAIRDYSRKGGKITMVIVDEDTPVGDGRLGTDSVDSFLIGV